MNNAPIIRCFQEGSPCIIVAEIGNNHQGDPDLARKCIDHAAQAGADMVKMQKRHMPTMFTEKAMQRPYYGPNSFGPTYGAHRQSLELSLDVMAELKTHAESLGLGWFASVWDEYSLEELVRLGVACIKIPSADITHESLLRKASATGLPLILSTGMSTLEHIDRAVEIVSNATSKTILLHCNSTYPCPPEEIALPVLPILRARYGLPVGYSGHEEGIGPSVAAVALGACMVERHFTLDRTLPGTDHACSLTPTMFADMVRMIRDVEAAMRVTEKRLWPAEAQLRAKLRKTLVTARNLPAGHRLNLEDMAFMCTGSGGGETTMASFIGTVLLYHIPVHTPLDSSMVRSGNEEELP